MDESRPDTRLWLPQVGDPLLALPGDQTFQSHAVWRRHHHLWCAPVLPNGLVAWSRSCPVVGSAYESDIAVLARPLEAPEVTERVRGEEQTSAGLLPQPGQPLLVNFALGRVYWMLRRHLVQGPWFDDGLLGFGPVRFVAREDAGLRERVVIDHAAWTLREATPGGPGTRLYLPPGAAQPRDIQVNNRSIDTVGRSPRPDEPSLHLRTRDGYRLPSADAVILDREMALALAAEVIAYPSAQQHPATFIRHPLPDLDDGIVTTWQVADDLAVGHDVRHAPFTLWLRCPQKYPLTADCAERLAGALVAGADLLNRIRHLTVIAVANDRPRYQAVRAEGEFAASLLTADRSGV